MELSHAQKTLGPLISVKYWFINKDPYSFRSIIPI